MYETCALCSYLKSRETGRYQFRFTKDTVFKNVITRDASLSKQKFNDVINYMKSNNFITPDKTSFKLTPNGENLYWIVKADNFSC